MTPDRLIFIPAGSKELEVIVGIESKVIDLNKATKEPVSSDGAKAVLIEHGKIEMEKTKALEEAQAEEKQPIE